MHCGRWGGGPFMWKHRKDCTLQWDEALEESTRKRYHPSQLIYEDLQGI